MNSGPNNPKHIINRVETSAEAATKKQLEERGEKTVGATHDEEIQQTHDEEIQQTHDEEIQSANETEIRRKQREEIIAKADPKDREMIKHRLDMIDYADSIGVANFNHRDPQQRAIIEACMNAKDPAKQEQLKKELESWIKAQSEDSPDVTDLESAENGKQNGVNLDKATKNNGVKAVVRGAVFGALATIGIFAAVAGAKDKNPYDDSTPSTNTEYTQDYVDQDQDSSENMESISEKSTYRGHFASEDGTTYNANKGAKVNFGEALKTGVSEAESKEDLIGRMTQPGQLATTYFYMQEKTTNPDFGVEGAKFNNPNELKEAMKNDPELHQRVYDYIKGTFQNNSLADETVNGKFHNFYMDSQFETGNVDTSNVEIVGCETNENGTKVKALTVMSTDKNGISHVDVFYFKDDCGGQPLDQIDFTSGVRQIPAEDVTPNIPDNNPVNPVTPDKPTPVVPVTPEKPDEPVTPEKPDEPVTPEKPDEPVTPEKPDTPTELESKDAENMVRIDENILDKKAENNGTKQVNIGQTTVTPEEVTTQPVSTNETAPTIVQNEAAPEATVINPSEYNSIAEDLGGANVGYEYAPVQSDEAAQAIADAAEIPIDQAPTSEQDINDALSDLGIN